MKLRETSEHRSSQRLARQIAKLEQQLAEALQHINKLEQENSRLKQQLAEARKDSSTSSKPPSSDIVKPKKPPGKGGKKRNCGGQRGHKRHERPSFPAEMIDDILPYTLDACPDCGGELLARLPGEACLNVDETGHKENAKKFWTRCFRAELYTLFRIEPTRSSQVLIDTLGEEFNGVLGCDYFGAYRKYMRKFGVLIDRRITQGTRSETGRRWCERIWTVIATCAQQGRSAFDFLLESVESHLRGAPPPSLLPSGT